MADLGSLYFDVLLRDKTAAERAKMKADLLRDLQIQLNVSVDTKTLTQQIRNDLLQNPFKIGIVVDKATATQAVQQALSQVRTWNGKYTDSDLRAERGRTQQAIQQWKEAQAELARVKAAHVAAKDAASAHASASISLGGAMGSNITIAGRLGAAMAGLYSVHMAKDFLANVIEIGGELEHQKIAMDTIFGDKGKRIDLFDKITTLARNSPFGVMELTKSVKALSAYGVEYNEIYETAKRLADISAATSVDINRLILAFGKTKSRTFLDGLEAKQFAYANIPIYDMLSKKLTELEGKFVSVKDVMGRIKKRDIGFDLVKEALWDLTDEGGKFYNMQEALAGSVKTSWKLVKDNIELMYGELAESLAGPLKGTAEILQALTREWQTVAWVLGAAAVSYGVLRASCYATNLIMTKQTATTYEQIMSEKAHRAEMLKLSSTYQTLTFAERRQILTANRLTNEELKQLVVTEKLKLADLQRLIALRKLDAAHIKFLLDNDMMNAALVKQATHCNVVTIRLKALGIALQNAGKAAWAFLSNPWTLGMAAISGIVTLWQKNSQEMDKAKEIGDNIFTKATESAKSLHNVLSEINDDFSSMSDFEIKQVIEKLETAIRDYAGGRADRIIADSTVGDDGNLRDHKERAEILRREVEYLEQANKLTEQWNLGDKIAQAIDKADSGWFDDSLTTDFKDYVNAYQSAEGDLTEYMTNHATQAQQILATAKEIDSSFANEARTLSTWQEQFSLLIRNTQRFRTAWDKISHDWYDSDGIKSEFQNVSMLYTDWGGIPGFGSLDIAKKEATTELTQFMTYLKTSLSEAGVDFSRELSVPVKIALNQAADTIFEEIQNLPQDRQDELKSLYYQMFGLDFDTSVLSEAMREKMNENMDSLGEELAEKIRNGQELNDAEKAKVKELMTNLKADIAREFPHLAQYIQGLIDDQQWVGEILLTFNRNKMLTEWQQTMIEVWGSDNAEITAVIKAAPDVMSAYTALAELRKETNEWLTKFGTLKLPVGFVYQPGKLFDENQINSLTDPIARQMLLDANQRIATINSLTAGQSTSGVNLANFEKNKNKGKGNHTDKFLEQMKERMNLLKKAYDEYKKWLALVDKEEALAKVKGSGIFDALFSGNAPVDLDDYKGELQKLLNQLEGKANTKGRRELVVSIKTLLNLDMPRDEVKETAESLKTQMEAEISRIGKEWDLYKQFVDAGASKKEASLFAFGLDSAPFKNQAEAQAKRVEEFMRDKGIEIPFTTSIEDATEQLGGADSPLYNMFFKAWKEAKEAIEKDELEIRIREVTAINKYKSIAEKIASLNEKYGTYTGLEVGESGELEEKEGMTAGQRAMFREYQDKLAELKGELLTLLPIWEQIFGDHTYQSYGQIQKAADVVRQIVSNASVQKTADGKPTIYTSSYVDDEGKTVNVSGQYSQLEKLKKALDDLYKEGVKKNPFATLAKNLKDVFKGGGDMKDKKTIEKISMIGESAAESADMIGSLAGQLGDMFDALGNDAAAEAMNTVGDVMNSVSNIGQGFAKGGLIGGIAAAAGEAIGWVTKIFQAHDKKLQKTIEASQLAAKQIQGIYDAIERRLEYHLGSGKTLQLVDYDEDVRALNTLNAKIAAIKARGEINFFDLAQLSKYTKEAEKLQKRITAYDEGGAYGYQRQLMTEQLAELEKQRQAEIDKKKTNWDSVADYEAQIDEMRVQIRQFAEETASTLYGINIKDWASQIGDALFDAWKRGEDGAEAFKNAVASIMGDVMNSILKLSILEPAMEDLRTMLFGNDGMSGMFGKDFELDDKELESIGDYLMGLSAKSDDYYDMLDKLDKYMQDKYGVSMKENEASSSGSSKGIQSVTESTADLLASYINAIRADVAMKREYVRLLIEELFPRYNLIAEAQLRQLEQIAKNTGRNADAAEEILAIINSNNNPGVGFKIS